MTIPVSVHGPCIVIPARHCCVDKITCTNCRHCERQRSNPEQNFNGTSIWIASLTLAMTGFYAAKGVHATMPSREGGNLSK